jgi:hypothetical protein
MGTLTVRVRDRRYTVRIATYDGGLGAGIGYGGEPRRRVAGM